MREFKLDDVIFEVIVRRAVWKREQKAPSPGAPRCSQRRRRGKGGKRKIYLKRRKSAMGYFAVRCSISTKSVYIFLADSQDAVSLHMTTFFFFFFPGKSFASSQTFPRECLSEPLLNYKEVFIVGGD